MKLVTLAAAFALAAIPVVAQTTMPATAPAATQTDSDKSFVDGAVSSSLYEVEASQLALSNTQSSSIRTYAQRMIDDHTRASQELMTTAGEAGIEPVDEMSAKHAEMLAALREVPEDAFNRRYAEQQIAANREAIELYEAQARNGKNDALRSYADEFVPVIQQHHAMAQDLPARLDQGQ